MIVDGRAIAREILARTRVRAEKLSRRPKVVAYVTSHPTPATESYLKIKERSAAEAGCDFETRELPIHEENVAAVIVQLPLPLEMDQNAILDSIPVEKDADVLSTAARMKFEADEPDALIPPVAGAVAEIFKVSAFDPRGKKAVVIGAGWLVGNPCATLLSHMGADVSHVTLESGDLSQLKGADIIVSGAGSPHLITPEMIKDGVILIDAGTSNSPSTSSGRPSQLAGDADPACAEKCSLFTPVPGGVGPIAVAKLFENAVTLAEQQTSAILSA